jgi:hypothetical protein
MNESEVIGSLAGALEYENLTIESKVENTEVWDSLGSLTIYATLSRITNGRSDKINGLVTLTSIREIIDALRSNGIIE